MRDRGGYEKRVDLRTEAAIPGAAAAAGRAPARAWASPPTRSRWRPARSRSRSASWLFFARAVARGLRADPALDVPAHGASTRSTACWRASSASRAALGAYLNELTDVRLRRRALPAVRAGRAVQPVLGRRRDRAGGHVASSPARWARRWAPRAATTARWARATAPSCSARSASASALGWPLPAWSAWLMPLLAALVAGPSSTASAARWPRPAAHARIR